MVPEGGFPAAPGIGLLGVSGCRVLGAVVPGCIWSRQAICGNKPVDVELMGEMAGEAAAIVAAGFRFLLKSREQGGPR